MTPRHERSGGVVVVVEGPWARAVPVLARYQDRLMGRRRRPPFASRWVRATWLAERLGRLGLAALGRHGPLDAGLGISLRDARCPCPLHAVPMDKRHSVRETPNHFPQLGPEEPSGACVEVVVPV